MDAQQARLVQESFAHARRIAPHLAATFYRELFAIDPTLRPLFKGDIIAQSQKLMAMLTHVVERLHAPNEILPGVRELGARHAAYGVIEPRQYAAVGTALLRTLRHELGPDLSPQARDAWAAAYRLLSEEMRAAGQQARQRSA